MLSKDELVQLTQINEDEAAAAAVEDEAAAAAVEDQDTMQVYSDIKSIENKYPGITTYTENDLRELTAKADHLNGTLKMFKEIKSNLK